MDASARLIVLLIVLRLLAGGVTCARHAQAHRGPRAHLRTAAAPPAPPAPPAPRVVPARPRAPLAVSPATTAPPAPLDAGAPPQ